MESFDACVRDWFYAAFDEPTPCQRDAWRAVKDGRPTLIAAPTGSGKTLAAFLSAIDDLVCAGQHAPLPDETHVLYVSPLKALSNDIQKNLEAPLEGIQKLLRERGLTDVGIRTMVRTGDTPSAARAAMRKTPPHILVTTPESLYILLTSEGGREVLKSVRSVIVDEIHALAGNKRGAHLSLSLERLEALVPRPLQRIGLSATQRPIELVADFLVGGNTGRSHCEIVDSGHVRDRDLALEIPSSPLEAVMAGEVWGEIYDRLAELITAHRTTLIFVNTRRLAERLTRHLSERLGDEHVTSHHGSLSKEKRHSAEQRLKDGQLKALVATASLELGIDIGDIDLVCQIGSTRSISAFLQRVGRSGHGVGRTPKGRLFPLSRDELVECTALLLAIQRGDLDRLCIPNHPLDVLAQQLVAAVAAGEWEESDLYAMVTRAYPYRDLTREKFGEVLDMLAQGFSTRRGRRSAYIHRDAVNARVRARRGARLTAMTCGGAIPDNADYDVILEPNETYIGSLNEDFAIESLPGDIFQLGNSSWRILRVEAGRVRVADAQGLPPTIPFWVGEAPGRTDELSEAVSLLRTNLVRVFEETPGEADAQSRARARHWLESQGPISEAACDQLVDYLAAARNALGALPTLSCVVMERFFDESGGMQLVIHSTFGSRVNKAWGLALRKRFCRKFNFELQAAATEDAIVLSLGETHSFEIADVARYLNAKTVYDVLVQALLAAPVFDVRWRWNATISLAIPRFQGGKKVPPQLQRIKAEDLVSVVFPDQIACAENLAGEREVPDHPLVDQTIDDALHEAMDIDGLKHLLEGLRDGSVQVVTRDLTEPSPLAQEILNAKPYAFLDDVPLEERRTQAVMSRRWLDPDQASDIGRLDEEAIERVQAEAWPEVTNADELHDALMTLGFVQVSEIENTAWGQHLNRLLGDGRATKVGFSNGVSLWTATERLPEVSAAFDIAGIEPDVTVPPHLTASKWSRGAAHIELMRARLSGLGPVDTRDLAASASWSEFEVETALRALEGEGFALRGQFLPSAGSAQWCERRLLARIHRYTVKRLRAEIEPVSAATFMRFLFEWQSVSSRDLEGPSALAGVLDQLAGYQAPAAAWEASILPARVTDYDPQWLDNHCLSGRYTWLRLSPKETTSDTRVGPIRTSPIAILPRRHLTFWLAKNEHEPTISANARRLHTHLTTRGASFFDELVVQSGLMRTQVEGALAELVALGLATSDSFVGLRALLTPSNKRRALGARRGRRSTSSGIEDAGRWSTIITEQAIDAPGEDVEHAAWQFLYRYGVVARRLLERETTAFHWREFLQVYRRAEARGELRGGRFIAGLTGEQYALPDAVTRLRAVRRTTPDGELIAVSAADPLNLAGIMTPDTRVPAIENNRVLFRDGEVVAVQLGKDIQFVQDVDESAQWATRNALVQRKIPPALKGYLKNTH